MSNFQLILGVLIGLNPGATPNLGEYQRPVRFCYALAALLLLCCIGDLMRKNSLELFGVMEKHLGRRSSTNILILIVRSKRASIRRNRILLLMHVNRPVHGPVQMTLPSPDDDIQKAIVASLAQPSGVSPLLYVHSSRSRVHSIGRLCGALLLLRRVIIGHVAA